MKKLGKFGFAIEDAALSVVMLIGFAETMFVYFYSCFLSSGFLFFCMNFNLSMKDVFFYAWVDSCLFYLVFFPILYNCFNE